MNVWRNVHTHVGLIAKTAMVPLPSMITYGSTRAENIRVNIGKPRRAW